MSFNLELLYLIPGALKCLFMHLEEIPEGLLFRHAHTQLYPSPILRPLHYYKVDIFSQFL